MLSIFIMYSPDRQKAIEATVSCLSDMDLYQEAQKTIVTDGRCNIVLDDWEVVNVPRLGGKFCWGRMWDAGVLTARHPLVLYMDCDRLLPKNYLKLAVSKSKLGAFIFTSMHFMMLQEMPVSHCKLFLSRFGEPGLFLRPEVRMKLQYELRRGRPHHGPGKNVMSGSVMFHRETYLSLGGVDHWYCGHGAYADSDFHYTASLAGCEFIDLGLPELHWPHSKVDEHGLPLDERSLWHMALDNFVYYCDKWKLPRTLAEDLARRSDVADIEHQVGTALKRLQNTPRYF